MINVDGSDDPSYRYKMPRIVSKVEGRGNGVKTALMNCSEVAAALKRSTAQVTKYFGCELGAISSYEEKTNRALVNGSFVTNVLQEALTGYIKKFVLCPSCGNPETVQEMKGKKKSAIIMLNCKACGASEMADNTHKLVTFIIKEMSGDGSKKSKKEERRKKKLEKSKMKNGDENTADGSVSDEEKKKKKKKKKKKDKDKDGSESKKSKKKKKKRKEKKDSSSEGLAEEETKVDEMGNELGALTVHDVAALNTSVDRVTSYLLEKGPDEVLAFVKEQQVNSGLRKADRIPILFFALYNQSIPLAKMVSCLQLLQKLIEPIKDCFLSPEDIEVELFLCMEEAVMRVEDEEERAKVRKNLPMVLKTLFDEELVEEEQVLAWFKGSLDPVKYKHFRCVVEESELQLMKTEAKPIIDWLTEAETDTESEEE